MSQEYASTVGYESEDEMPGPLLESASDADDENTQSQAYVDVFVPPAPETVNMESCEWTDAVKSPYTERRSMLGDQEEPMTFFSACTGMWSAGMAAQATYESDPCLISPSEQETSNYNECLHL